MRFFAAALFFANGPSPTWWDVYGSVDIGVETDVAGYGRKWRS
jgi:hypothetical protein